MLPRAPYMFSHVFIAHDLTCMISYILLAGRVYSRNTPTRNFPVISFRKENTRFVPAYGQSRRKISTEENFPESPWTHTATAQSVDTAYGSLPIPYGTRVALFTDETVFVCRFLRAQSTSHLLTYFSLYFNPTHQLLISTKGMICHWFHGALSGSFLS